MLLLNSKDRRLMKETEEYLLFEKNPLEDEGNEEEIEICFSKKYLRLYRIQQRKAILSSGDNCQSPDL